MAWTDGTDLATGTLVTGTIWNNYNGAAGSLMQLKGHAHGGVTGEGSQSLGPLVLGDFTDAAAPAAPGAGKTRVYTTAGVVRFRAGAAGADMVVGLGDTLAGRPQNFMAASVTRFRDVTTDPNDVFSPTEAVAEIIMPRAGTARNLRLRTSTAQPASGSLVITLRKNGVDTAITFTIAAGAAAGMFTDLVNTVAYAAGDLMALKLVNNATAGSATIETFSLEYGS
jgi:hypothetical protein